VAALGKSIIRIGVQESTRKGMKEAQMDRIADLIARALIEGEESHHIRGEIDDLLRHHQDIEFSFDNML
jgi:glycine/serine hydroxymethyltransferase